MSSNLQAITIQGNAPSVRSLIFIVLFEDKRLLLQIIDYRTSIFTATGKIHGPEENHSGLAIIMETLLQQKRQIENLEIECCVPSVSHLQFQNVY